MDSRMAYQGTQTSALQQNRVLRNTYSLLAMTLAFAAVVAGVAMAFNLPMPNIIIFFVGTLGLSFLLHKTANSSMGLVTIFAYTGFLGYTVGPIVNMYVAAGGADIVLMALAGTALSFFGMSAYALTTKRDLSFMGGMITAGFIVAIVAIIANIFLAMPALSLAISGIVIMISSGAIMLQTQAIVRGGETNYILAAAALFASIYNIFISLLNILNALSGDD
ncbi:Bax inhibitor-1/YccA family protein [Psychrosphaera ytuae]|uniref:Bax inhibitor-1/YccA family protein n=1 Tax=Psychrosphaera ytuae TaxID=2820710 RepID=A0A975DCF0_9GAMM|nr:Bax inhibitor-1/YccA family protein [Psychrosphaera ytuae]QTH64582.1 Bax inhibitor-1/YccA family protein [Psychrosphaera ytuae]